MIRSKTQTFNTGTIGIYAVKNAAANGDMPKKKLYLRDTLRYHKRTLGVKRYYNAMQAQQQIDMVIRCPLRKMVSALDVAVLDGVQYRIDLVQQLDTISPPVMDLTLSRLGQDYEFAED